MKNSIPVKYRVRGETLLTHGSAASNEINVTIEAIEVIHAQFRENFLAVCKKRNIQAGELNDLSFRLLCELEPSLQFVEVKRTGRPNRWHGLRAFYLWWDVEILRASKNSSIVNACKLLERSLRWKDDSSDCLRSAYRRYAVKSPLVPTFKKMIDHFGLEKVEEVYRDFLYEFRPELNAHLDETSK